MQFKDRVGGLDVVLFYGGDTVDVDQVDVLLVTEVTLEHEFIQLIARTCPECPSTDRCGRPALQDAGAVLPVDRDFWKDSSLCADTYTYRGCCWPYTCATNCIQITPAQHRLTTRRRLCDAASVRVRS